jgi:hypothetical protein
MKPAAYLFPAILALAACKREETTGTPPKAVEVEENALATNEAAEAPKAIVIPEERVVPRAVAVPEEGGVIVPKAPAAPTPPRKRLPQVVDKVGQGLETAGQKTREAAASAEVHTEEVLGIAREKTETGLRKAADATGKFIQRAGEKIEEKAGEADEP